MLAEFRSFLGSGTARSGLSLVVSGLSFAIANLILARKLPLESYAIFTLLVAIIMLASSIGMMGADGVVNRHPVAPNMRIFARVATTSTIVAIAAAALAVRVYELSAVLAALLVPMVIALTITRLCGAWLRSWLHLVESLTYSNSFSYLLLAAALLSWFAGLDNISMLLLLVLILQCAIAAGAVTRARSLYQAQLGSYEYSWREALVYVFMISSMAVLVQLERLVTPRMLELSDLAVLGVLLAIVGPPFRLLQMALGYELLPILRKTHGNVEKKTLIVKHLMIALILIIPLWIVIWYVAPLIQKFLLSEEYAMSGQLILAALVAGTIKSFSGIAQSSVTALSSVRGMEIMGVVGWLGVVIAVFAASYGARYGLAGVIYAIGLGWAIQLFTAPIVVIVWHDDANPFDRDRAVAGALSVDSLSSEQRN